MPPPSRLLLPLCLLLGLALAPHAAHAAFRKRKARGDARAEARVVAEEASGGFRSVFRGVEGEVDELPQVFAAVYSQAQADALPAIPVRAHVCACVCVCVCVVCGGRGKGVRGGMRG